MPNSKLLAGFRADLSDRSAINGRKLAALEALMQRLRHRLDTLEQRVAREQQAGELRRLQIALLAARLQYRKARAQHALLRDPDNTERTPV
jgi:hypothetical protein